MHSVVLMLRAGSQKYLFEVMCLFGGGAIFFMTGTTFVAPTNKPRMSLVAVIR